MIGSMKSLLSRLFPSNSFARNVSLLVSGTAVSQIIPIAISPILTRLFEPDEFGLVALYMSCVAVVVTIATARYELAITLPVADDDAAHLVSFTLKLCAVVCGLLYFPIALFGQTLSMHLGNPELAVWFYLLPVSVLAIGTFNAFQQWCNRKSLYRRMSASRVEKSGFTALLNISLGLGQIKGGMIIGNTIGQIFSSFLLGSSIWRRNRQYFTTLKLKGEIAQAKRYINHPKHIAPAQLFGVIAQQIPFFMIGGLYSLATIGFFSMAYRLVSLPTGLIATAIGDVYRQRISVAYNEQGKFREIFIKTITRTSLLAAPPFLVLYFAAPFLFELFFGTSWREAGEYAQTLVVSSFFQFIFTPIDKGAVVVGATRYIFGWHIVRLIGYVLMFFIAWIQEFPIQALLWIFVFINVALYVFDGLIEFYLSKGIRHDKR